MSSFDFLLGRPLTCRIPLEIMLHNLFYISQIPKGIVGEIGSSDKGSVTWDLKWRIPFFVHEEPLVVDFFFALQEVQLNVEMDKWVWIHAKDDSFYVASAYQVQVGLLPLLRGMWRISSRLFHWFERAELLLRWWFFLGSFCQIGFSQRKVYSSGKLLLLQRGPYVLFMGIWSNRLLFFFCLVQFGRDSFVSS